MDMNPSMQPLRIDRRPLHIQVQERLRTLIAGGVYQAGQQLPPEARLSAELGVSRPTLREALLNLEREGIIVRKHGVGTFVAPGYGRRLQSGLERLESILGWAARQGMEVGFDDLQVQEEPADSKLADRLQVTPGTLLTSVHRAIVVDGVPVAYMSDFAPASVLVTADVDATFTGSVLDLLRQKQGLRTFLWPRS
jgi:GntR family transcriptional regulator